MSETVTMSQVLAEPRYLLLPRELGLARGGSFVSTWHMMPDARRPRFESEIFVADVVQMRLPPERNYLWSPFIRERVVEQFGPVTIARYNAKLERLGLSFGTVIEDRPASDREFYGLLVDARNATSPEKIAELRGLLKRDPATTSNVGTADTENTNVQLRQELKELYILAGKQVGEEDLLTANHPLAVRKLMAERLLLARRTVKTSTSRQAL